jgi:hypothetical protein
MFIHYFPRGLHHRIDLRNQSRGIFRNIYQYKRSSWFRLGLDETIHAVQLGYLIVQDFLVRFFIEVAKSLLHVSCGAPLFQPPMIQAVRNFLG